MTSYAQCAHAILVSSMTAKHRLEVILCAVSAKRQLTKKDVMETSNSQRYIYIDIMLKGRFYRQIPYKYSPLWNIQVEDVKQEVESKYPYLKNKKYTLGFSSQRIAR